MLRWLALALLVVGCEARLARGTGCSTTSECSTPYVCAAGRCRVECATQRDCPLGTFCRLAGESAGTCSLPDDPDCRTSGCTTGLACVGSLCVDLCASIAECPDGSACTSFDGTAAHCVRVEGGLDAALPDVGPDAVPSDAGPPPCAPGACDPIVDLAAGGSFTCVRTAGERAYCFGAADSVARGPAPAGCTTTGCTRPASVLTEIAAGDVREAAAVVDLDARENGACIAVRGAPPLCWAERYTAAALANRGDGRYARPALRAMDGPPAPEARGVFVLSHSVLAIGADDAWLAWGFDGRGQHGQGSSTTNHAFVYDADAPVPGATRITPGDEHACTIVAGDVWCWGANDYGEAGDTATAVGTSILTPIVVPGVRGATELALGLDFGCALVGTEVRCWGNGALVGNPPWPPECEASTLPAVCSAVTVVRTGPPFVHLAIGASSEGACAIDSDGGLWCWGAAPFTGGAVPGLVDLPGRVSLAVLGASHLCALVDGELWCGGENYYGQLGRVTPPEGNHALAPVEW